LAGYRPFYARASDCRAGGRNAGLAPRSSLPVCLPDAAQEGSSMATDRLSVFWPDSPKRPAKSSKEWPEGYDEELDGVMYLPAEIPYRVLSASGRVLGTFYDRLEALAAFKRWSQAVVVSIGNVIIADARKGAA
jgi:hypothetical protein